MSKDDLIRIQDGFREVTQESFNSLRADCVHATGAIAEWSIRGGQGDNRFQALGCRERSE